MNPFKNIQMQEEGSGGIVIDVFPRTKATIVDTQYGSLDKVLHDLYFNGSSSGGGIAPGEDAHVRNLYVDGSILPNGSDKVIGDKNNRFKAIYVDEVFMSTNTLYIGDTPILGTNQDTIQIKADPNQSINMMTSGAGVTKVLSESGVEFSTSGMNANVVIQAKGVNSQTNIAATSAVNFNAPSLNFTGESRVDNLTVRGNLHVLGDTVNVDAEQVRVKDNIIEINKGEPGSGVTAGTAGLRVDRGDAPNYNIIFDEADDLFKVGMDNDLETIASREWVKANSTNYVHPATHPASMITGLAPVATSGNYNDLTNKPTSFPPASHNHDGLYLKLTGGTINGGVTVNTNTNTTPFVVSRSGNLGEAMKVGVDDGATTFEYTNDEFSSRFRWILKNTDTESADGGRASTHTLEFGGSNTDKYLQLDGSRFYHTGFKPTASDIGASPVGHGHTQVGGSALKVIVESTNEINFGGTSQNADMFFGYSSKEGRPVPTNYIFGSSATGTANLKAKDFYASGNKVYHAGNKPTPAELGVAKSQLTNEATIINEPISVFNQSASSVIGILKILLPKTWSSTMLSFDLINYDYSASGKTVFHISGYNYSGDGGQWVNTQYSVVGKPKDKTVRFGRDTATGKCCILIGQTTTNWSYPKFVINNLLVGHQNLNNWNEDWQMSIVSNIDGVDKVVTGSDTSLDKSSEVGDTTLSIKPHRSNEINFGGDFKENQFMFFGYRDIDGRPAPTKYVFGSTTTGTAEVYAKELYASGNRVYHTGFKPTASDIGAATSNHDHNALYYTRSDIDNQTFKRRGVVAGDTNWNTVREAGTYKVQMSSWVSGKNAPEMGLYSYGLLEVLISGIESEGRVIQIYYPHRKDQPRAFRMCNNDVWEPWQKWHVEASADGRYQLKEGTVFTKQANYVAVRTEGRTTEQYYEFWDNGAGWATLKVGEVLAGNGTNKVYHSGNKPTASDIGALAKSGGTLTGSLTLPSGQNNGLRINQVKIDTVSAKDLAIRNVDQIRFGDTDNWNWNEWGGLKYSNANKTIYMGGANGEQFSANGSASDINIDLTQGVSMVKVPTFQVRASKTYDGNKSPANTSQIGIVSNNNGMGIGLDGTFNSRSGWIQVGHSDDQYHDIYGTLRLNPKGGDVAIGSKCTVTGTSFNLTQPLDIICGGGSLKLRAGTTDHMYIEFYPRTSNTGDRHCWMGYGSVGDSQFTINAEKGGRIIMMPGVHGTEESWFSNSKGWMTDPWPNQPCAIKGHGNIACNDRVKAWNGFINGTYSVTPTVLMALPAGVTLNNTASMIDSDDIIEEMKGIQVYQYTQSTINDKGESVPTTSAFAIDADTLPIQAVDYNGDGDNHKINHSSLEAMLAESCKYSINKLEEFAAGFRVIIDRLEATEKKVKELEAIINGNTSK